MNRDEAIEQAAQTMFEAENGTWPRYLRNDETSESSEDFPVRAVSRRFRALARALADAGLLPHDCEHERTVQTYDTFGADDRFWSMHCADCGTFLGDARSSAAQYEEEERQLKAYYETERDELRRRIERVLALHCSTSEPVGDPLVRTVRACVECSDDHAISNSLDTGIVPWPCATVEALTEQEHAHD